MDNKFIFRIKEIKEHMLHSATKSFLILLTLALISKCELADDLIS